MGKTQGGSLDCPRTGVAVLFVLLVFLAAGVCCGKVQPEGPYSYRAMNIDQLRKGFADPPAEAGPWVYWFCYDNAIKPDEMRQQVRDMVDAGIAGAELRFVEFAWWRAKETVDKELAMVDHKRLEYLSDEFVQALEAACAEAERQGFKLAINMGMGWPPGGTWITGEYRTKMLKSQMTVLPQGKAADRDVQISVPKGANVYAWQLEDVKEKSIVPGSFRDISGNVRSAGDKSALFWDTPAGDWLVGVYWIKNGGGLDKAYGYAADPGSKDKMDYHLNYIFDRLKPRLGKYFGTTLTEVASDSWEYDGQPYWTEAMDETFLKLNGYELTPRLYAMAGYGDDREKILADIEHTEQTLIRDNFYIHVTGKLNGLGLRHRAQIRGRGLSRDFFEAYVNSDIPEVEEEVCPPESAWVGHTLGKPIVSCEAMTFISRYGDNLKYPVEAAQKRGPGRKEPVGIWEANPGVMRQHSNAHYGRGINRLLIHGYDYSPPGVPLPGWRMYAEMHLNENVPWWPYMKNYSDWSRRLQWVLQSGWPVADTLVYPVESNPTDGPYNDREDQPVSAINSVDAASRYSFVKIWDKDDYRYDVDNLCVTGDIETLAEAQKVQQMLKRGVKVTYCGVEPVKWGLFAENRGKEAGDIHRSFEKAIRDGKLVDGREQGWKKVVASNQSINWYPADGLLTYFHRRVEGGEVYFVTNWDSRFEGQVEFDQSGLIPHTWDADTGRIAQCTQYSDNGSKIRVGLRLGHLESAVIVFTKDRELPHVATCRNGTIRRDGDKLYAVPDGERICRIEMPDGTIRGLSAKRIGDMPLDTGWELRVSDKDGVGVDGDVELGLDKLVSWRQIERISTCSGTASYTVQFEADEELLGDDMAVELDLGRVYEVAEVRLNGKEVGVSWYKPHKLDITGHLKPGRNELRIDVTNILKNHLEKGDYTRPSGLLGPVRIRAISIYRI